MISLALLVTLPALASADVVSRSAGRQQAIDYVVARGLSQRGVPYTYGGGNATGPTTGVAPATTTGLAPATVVPSAQVVGFDSSGLIQYAFAGVGIALPRSSAEQFGVGRRVAPAQALPGDLIFYGPGGNQSVALFLGNGLMLEATEPAVTVSTVRTVNMAPYLTRVIQ